MELYLLKSGACIGIFYAFYLIFLEKESVHTFKRFYLIGSVLGSFLIPLITFTQYIEVMPIPTPIFSSEGLAGIPMPVEETISYVSIILASIYGLGALLFGLKFGKNLYSIFQKIKKNPKYRDKSVYHVLLKTHTTPHTFFNFIFLNKSNYESKEIPEAVLLHETAHAEQKHSLDILCIEFLQVIFWFNPLIYFIKRSIKLNHEFLADRAVLQEGIETSTYQHLLLAFSSSAKTPAMANSINYSLIKKRFTVMKTKTKPRAALLRTFLILPILAILIYGFSSKETIEVISEENTTSDHILPASSQLSADYNAMARFWNQYFKENPGKREMPLTELRKLETMYRAMTPEQKLAAEPFPECSPKKVLKATPEQLAEYNRLAKKYNSMPRDNMHIKGKELTRMKYIYELMTPEQKKNAEPFPNLPPPPPPPDAPKPMKVIIGVNDGDVNAPPPPPPAPPAVKGVNDGGDNIPPPPPPPESPLDHIIEMAKKGATFYYEGKKIPSDQAIKLIKKNNSLNIQTIGHSSNNPTVKLSKKPISFDKTSAAFHPEINIQTSNLSLKTGNVKINGDDYFYTSKNGVTSYFDKFGQQVDKNGTVLTDVSKQNPTYYYNGNKISSEKAKQLLQTNTNIQVATENHSSGEYAIVLTNLTTNNSNINRNKNFNNQTQDPQLINLTEVIAKGATFFYNDKKISTEKAQQLAKRSNKIAQVNVIEGENGKPVVRFWSKEQPNSQKI